MAFMEQYGGWMNDGHVDDRHEPRGSARPPSISTHASLCP